MTIVSPCYEVKKTKMRVVRVLDTMINFVSQLKRSEEQRGEKVIGKLNSHTKKITL